MNIFSRLFVAALVLTAASTIASAMPVSAISTIKLDSYGTVNSTNSATAGVGASNTALYYYGYATASNPFTVAPAASNATYNLPTASPWAGIAGTNSSWVSFDPGNYPGGSNVAQSGVYYYYSNFNASATSTGSLTVLADDTTSIYLNSTLLTGAAAPTSGVNCTSGTPNCLVPVTYNLSGFVDGSNILVFGVQQDFGSATGLDFAGTVNVTPEPSSLLLLATGLMGAAGAVRRRIRA